MQIQKLGGPFWTRVGRNERERRHCTIAGAINLPVHAAAAKGDFKKVVAALDADPTLIHVVDRDACTLLQCAGLGKYY